MGTAMTGAAASSFVDVAPLLAQAGYRVTVPYVRGYGVRPDFSQATRHAMASSQLSRWTSSNCKLYYGHFFCNVFHQDYIVRKGADPKLLKRELLKLLDDRGAEYPAEHNVGHLYEAKPPLREFYEFAGSHQFL